MFATAEPPLPNMAHRRHGHFAGGPFPAGPLGSCGLSAGGSGDWGFGPCVPLHHPEHEPFHGPPHHPPFLEHEPFPHPSPVPGRHHLPGHFSPPLFPMEGMSPPHPSARPFRGGAGNGFPRFAPSPPHALSGACPGDSPPHFGMGCGMGMAMGMGFGGMPPLCSLRAGPAPPPLVSISSSTSSTSSSNNFCAASSSSSSSEGDSRFSSPERAQVPHPFGPGPPSGDAAHHSPSKNGSPARGSPPPSVSRGPSPPTPSESLRDLADPHYYTIPTHAPDCQVVVLTSRIKEKIPALTKTRWLDQQLSYRQCPYPIQRIEFTHAGDAVVQFISASAKAKALARPPLVWGAQSHQEIGTRNCTEDDIAALFWVGITGATPDLVPAVRQALQPYGEVRGQYAPHPSTVGPPSAFPLRSDLNTHAPEFLPSLGGSLGSRANPGTPETGLGPDGSVVPTGPAQMQPPVGPLPSQLDLSAGHAPAQGGRGMSNGGVPSSGILKLYFAPSGRRRLPATIHIHLPDRPKGCAPLVARVFTPHGPLAPKCADFGASHTEHGCPDCFKRSLLPPPGV